MTHQPTNMTKMESGAKRFSEGVGRVDNARNVTENDVTIGFPLLNGEMLYVNVPRARRWLTCVDLQNCCLVVFI